MISLAVLLFGCNDYDLFRPKDQTADPADEEPHDSPELEPDIEVEPLTLAFGAVGVGCDCEPQTLTIRNVGQADLALESVSLEGDGDSDFAIDGSPPASLAPGDEVALEVRFRPGLAATYALDVVVESNDPDEATVRVPTAGEAGTGAWQENAWTQGTRAKVDVLWVVDNSGSMTQAIDRVALGFQEFIDAWAPLELDWHLGVVTTDMANTGAGELVDGTFVTSDTPDGTAEFLALVDRGTSGSGVEQGTDAAYAALTEPLVSTTNAGFLRSDATLGIIVVSDEDDSSRIEEGTFTAWLDGLKGDPARTSFSAIVGDPWTGCLDFSSDLWADAGDRYVALAGSTGGLWESICASSYGSILADLARLQAPLTTSFALSSTPANPSLIEVTVDSAAAPISGLDGWTYDSASNSIEFHGAWTPAAGSEVRADYETASTCD